MRAFVSVTFRNNIFVFVALALAATVIYQTNALHFSDRGWFDGFQCDSRTLIVEAIVADDLGIDKHGGNMGWVNNPRFYKGQNRPVITDDSLKPYMTPDPRTTFHPYISSYGLQEVVFSKIYRIFGLKEFSQLEAISSFLLAVVMVTLYFLYRKVYDHLFAGIFLLVGLTSPWIIVFARNLFWVSFLWFIPAVFAALIYLDRRSAVRIPLLFGIACAVFLKSLTGYEYLSSITLFTCSVFVVAPFFRKEGERQAIDVKMFVLVFAACVAGFIAAILLHAGMKGDSILSGIRNIYEHDVKRRTYGDPGLALIDKDYRASLLASPFQVLKTYLTLPSPVFAWLPSRYFNALLQISALGLVYQFLARRPERFRYLALLGFFFLVPFSWIVAAKQHSFIHTHMNYVLWYLGFVQAMVYVCVHLLMSLWRRFLEEKQARRVNAWKSV